MSENSKQYLKDLQEHVDLNVAEYPKFKTKKSLEYMLKLFTILTKNKLPIPEELQNIIAEAITKGWLKNTLPKKSGAPEKSLESFKMLEDLYKQMSDSKYTKKHGLDSLHKNVLHFAKKHNKTESKIYKTRDKYGDAFANVQIDAYNFFKTNTTKNQKDILKSFFITKPNRLTPLMIDFKNKNPNSIKNRRKKSTP